MSDTAQLVKDKLDIVDFLRQYVELKPAGKNFKAPCPFHKEKTPSFMVSPERQSWHCFGSCSEGGDVIKFLMKYENLEFYDALKILAEKAGVEIHTSGNRDFQANTALYKVMGAAKDFYKVNLTRSDLVRNYLKDRGLKEETVQEFELGFAPDGSDVVTRQLLKAGYKIADIERAGLAVKTERGTYWDRFRGRIMFPIYNHTGKVVAFTGRILPETRINADQQSAQIRADGNLRESAFVPAKYVNSPETPIFQKSKVLYGFHKTKNDIRESKQAVLVEGQMDFLMLWQDGVKNAVASSGTALTQDHLTALRRLADELVLSFDADEAGANASERAIDLANSHDFSVRLFIIEDPQSKDPADVVKQQPGIIKKLLENSKSAMEYYLHRYVKNLPADLKLKKQNLRTMLSKIKNLSSPIDRSHWLKELAAIVAIEEKILAEEMETFQTALAPKVREEAPVERQLKEELPRRDLILQRLLGVLLHMKSDLQVIKDYMQYIPEKYLEAYKTVFEKREANQAPSDLDEMMSMVSMRFSLENSDFESLGLEKEAQTLLRQLKIEHLKDRRQQVRKLIQELERLGDETQLQEALKEFNDISRELENS